MASIPSNRPKQRIGQGTPVTAISSSSARLEGEAISKFGSSVEKLGSTLDQYNKEKDRIDTTQFKAQARAESILNAIDSMKEVKTNPLAKPDGSELQADFDAGYDGRTNKRIEGMSPEQQSLYKVEALGASLKFKGELGELAIQKHNAQILKNYELLGSTLAKTIAKNPLLMHDGLKLHKETVKVSPFTEGANGKIVKTSGVKMILSAVVGMNTQAQFDDAKKALDDKRIGEYLSTDEVKQVKIAIEDREEKFENKHHTRKERRIKDLERRQKTESNEAQIKAIGDRISADTPDKIQAADDAVDSLLSTGVISPAQHRTLKTDTANVSKSMSTGHRGKIMMKSWQGARLSKLKPEIFQLVGSKRMTWEDAHGLIVTLTAKEKSSGGSKSYARDVKNASAYIKALYTFDSVDDKGNPVYSEIASKEMVDISVAAKKLEEGEGLNPYDAAVKAATKVVGQGAAVHIPGISPDEQADSKSLDAAAMKLAKNLKAAIKNKKVSKENESRLREKLEKMKDKTRALRMQEQYNKIIKGSN